MASNPSPEVKAILKLTPALTTALSNEPLGVANTLLSEGLISSEVYSKVLVSTYSATEKAAIMIESARKVVEITPSKFTEFLDILSKVTCAKEVVESLRSIYQDELIHQRSHQFSVPSNSVSFTRTTPPSSVNTMSLASLITGPSPSQMMQYQERRAVTAHHGMTVPHTRMRVSHPEAAAATGMQEIQPTSRSMIKVDQPSMRMAHSEMGHMGMMQQANMHGQQQALYNTIHMQPHQMRGHMGHSAVHAGQPKIASGEFCHMIPHMTPPHHIPSATSMHSRRPQGEMMN